MLVRLQELSRRLTQSEYASLLQTSATTINDGDDENDNVTNTGLDFPRVDVLALGEAILAAPTLVELVSFEALAVAGKVLVSWETASEVENAESN